MDGQYKLLIMAIPAQSSAMQSPSGSGALSAQQIEAYHRDGLLIIRQLFSADELEPLRQAYRQDPTINGHVYGMEDNNGRGHPFCTWTDLGDDIVGMIPRMARMIAITETLLGEPCYHWHSKFSVKTSSCKARVDWHQDFGSWYDDGVLFPHMLTVGIAVESANKANGCVQFVPGSQQMGRIDHPAGANGPKAFAARVERARRQLGVVHAEMDVGDAVFFHCNTLHGSGLNETDTQRVMIFSSYNAVSNAPFADIRGDNKEGAYMGINDQERAYRPIVKLADDVLSNRSFRSAFSHSAFTEPNWNLSGDYCRAIKLKQ